MMYTIARAGPRLALAAALALSAVPADAQQADGGTLFKQRCQMCHTVTPDGKGAIGPDLYGVVGRKAASTGFAYSPALKASGLSWDKATLDKFLSGPMKLVPGTRMVITVSDPGQRKALIGYLASLKK